MTYPLVTGGQETLLAYDATNLGNTLYSSSTNPSRDTPGGAVKYVVPTIANGKVYVGAKGQISTYGLLATPTAVPPVISPGSGTFIGQQTVTIAAAANATIYYTIDGLMPNNSSAIYQSSTPLVVSTSETITAIASATGYITSAPASATYLSTAIPANPVLSLAAGTYSGTQTLTITESSPGAVVYYTLDGSVPTPNAADTAVYTQGQQLLIATSETVRAIAINPGPYSSSVVGAAYFIQPAFSINFTQGFTFADGPMQFNGSVELDDFRLQLTDGGQNEAGSAFYATPVNIQQFTTTFTFQLSNPAADGMTFTIQNNSPTAIGVYGGNLGYGRIHKSVAIKFDLYNSAGEGPNSTGLYVNGAIPTVPAVNLTGTGIDLHSGDYFNATITYDGANLTLILTDAITMATWSHVWPINIPATVGGNTAYVGFTGGTGGSTSSQKLTSWTYLAGPLAPNFGTGFAPGSMTLNGGAAFSGSNLVLTDGNINEARSAFFNIPVNVQQFSTTFNVQLTNASADGFTLTLQGGGPKTLGGSGSGLGSRGIPKSVAVKFDLYNNGGEGPNSTGIYLNGATPTVPALNLTGTGINLHSGDLLNVLLTYNGTTLTEVITDLATGAMAIETYTVNIPSIVGGNTAYAGFTASSGGASAVQQILNWSYTTTGTN
jgi:hypothetical protein